MEEMMRLKLLADIKAKRKVFHPEKVVEEFEAGPYTVRFKECCRLEHEAPQWQVLRMRWYSVTYSHLYSVEILAKEEFEDLKQSTIIDVACEAMRINRVTETA